MASALPALPRERLASLELAYAAAVRAKRLRLLLGMTLFGAALAVAAWTAEVSLPKLFNNLGAMTSCLGRIFLLENGQPVWTEPAEWFWGARKWLGRIGETLLIAYIGTMLGALGAFCLGFLSAANLMRSRAATFATRRMLEFCRTVPELVFALTFVVAFGLGPLPGVLAIAIHTLGALGKQFAEALENIDMKPIDGLTATGATWVESARFAALPQVASNFASYGLMRFEINVRGAAIMGFVGAGGIGQDLLTAIRKFYYSDVSAMLMMIIATVIVIDLVTERVRHRLLGREAVR